MRLLVLLLAMLALSAGQQESGYGSDRDKKALIEVSIFCEYASKIESLRVALLPIGRGSRDNLGGRDELPNARNGEFPLAALSQQVLSGQLHSWLPHLRRPLPSSEVSTYFLHAFPMASFMSISISRNVTLEGCIATCMEKKGSHVARATNRSDGDLGYCWCVQSVPVFFES